MRPKSLTKKCPKMRFELAHAKAMGKTAEYIEYCTIFKNTKCPEIRFEPAHPQAKYKNCAW
jgi:hypothetical protein